MSDHHFADSLTPQQDRAAGAVMGSIIGDALGVGPHWYYDLDELHAAYPTPICGYVPVHPGRYHDGVELGDVSQTGQFQQLLLESLVAKGTYQEEDYLRRLEPLLDTLDGEPESGRFTEQPIRDIWYALKVEGKHWHDDDFASLADTSEAAQRAVLIGARYHGDLMQAGLHCAACARLTHRDPAIVTASTAFGIVIGALVAGMPLDGNLGQTMRQMILRGELPFTHAVLAEEQHLGLTPPRPSRELPFPDVLLGMGWWIQAAQSPHIQVQPPEAIAQVYGMACSLSMLMPAAFFLAAHTPDSFEKPILTAINSGGNNMARAAMTGALCGAHLGLSAIPKRLITGLKDHQRWVNDAIQLAKDADLGHCNAELA
ncbi:ADP-ribosylglycohydrolase family protein [Ferrimonas sp. SCSIO 43195]|uniref:ADP-ribosylglycohydrolase family protein n=1 Tax=Ferrimonas sp. SCSIO 43195 TaxID=2822844 RepID=UPI0020762380|nr:ADP-ribosylglycohydrolase family protein [Ferrimonas sp. SCSIO 43195]USD39302.1 ADP-ribosylglycohydrolase family protein [Ferrimonas sp. SCSIO 43195]